VDADTFSGSLQLVGYLAIAQGMQTFSQDLFAVDRAGKKAGDHGGEQAATGFVIDQKLYGLIHILFIVLLVIGVAALVQV